ncbi:50S ribosome-binding GTPase [Ornithinimicrobium sp. Arc0846-15]|nr:50S ribosome-binding GTPase [Ornithinimicrobium laminariae]
MSPRRSTGSRSESLTWRADQLQEAIETGGTELISDAAIAGQRVVAKVRERWALKGGRTVVSLAGATGSGKSTLFNQLVGHTVADISARRPTTSRATAAIWGDEDATDLLNWLGVNQRHHLSAEGDQSDLDGLVLIDLPDFDSRELANRVEADRVLERSDVFVWVTDPQKYADARLHEDYLSALKEHETVMMVVLNQIDRVSEEGGVEGIKDDLKALVAADGAGDFTIYGTSARMGLGVSDVRQAIGSVVAERNAAENRLVGDLRTSATSMLSMVGETEIASSDVVSDDLLTALKQAAGVPVVLDAVQKEYLIQSKLNTGWPFSRWLSALRPDPLKRLRLGDDRAGSSGISPSDVRAVLGRSSLPPPTPAARSAVQLASRRVADRASEGLPPLWADAVSRAASPDDSSLADGLDQAVFSTSLRTGNPFWWSLLRFLQFVLAVATVVGFVWLAAIGVIGWLQMDIGVPTWGPLPIPAVLFVGGILAGLLLAMIARAMAGAGAKRRRALVEKRMDESVGKVAKQHIRVPVTTVLDRHRQTRQQLESAVS